MKNRPKLSFIIFLLFLAFSDSIYTSINGNDQFLEAPSAGVPLKKVVLKSSHNSQENTCGGVPFLIKV